MPLTLLLNGTSRTFDRLSDTATLNEVVAELGLQADRVAVEWNGEIVARTAWPTSMVSPGDKLEIVHFVGGGAL